MKEEFNIRKSYERFCTDFTVQEDLAEIITIENSEFILSKFSAKRDDLYLLEFIRKHGLKLSGNEVLKSLVRNFLYPVFGIEFAQIAISSYKYTDIINEICEALNVEHLSKIELGYYQSMKILISPPYPVIYEQGNAIIRNYHSDISKHKDSDEELQSTREKMLSILISKFLHEKEDSYLYIRDLSSLLSLNENYYPKKLQPQINEIKRVSEGYSKKVHLDFIDLLSS